MSDLSITAASVLPGAGAEIVHGSLGAAVSAGQTGYLDTTTNTWKLADSNGASALIRNTKGVFLNGGGVGQPCAVQTDGDITIGATLSPGVAYYQSDTPGGICPVADLATGEYPCLIGIAESTTVLRLGFQPSDVAL